MAVLYRLKDRKKKEFFNKGKKVYLLKKYLLAENDTRILFGIYKTQKASSYPKVRSNSKRYRSWCRVAVNPLVQ